MPPDGTLLVVALRACLVSTGRTAVSNSSAWPLIVARRVRASVPAASISAEQRDRRAAEPAAGLGPPRPGRGGGCAVTNFTYVSRTRSFCSGLTIR